MRPSQTITDRMPENTLPRPHSPGLILLLPPQTLSPALQAAVSSLLESGARTEQLPVSSDWRAELRACRERFPQKCLLRIRETQLWLAADALPRLLKVAEVAPGPVSPMCNSDAQLTPAAPDSELDGSDPAALDDASYLLGQRTWFELAAANPALLALAPGASADAALGALDHLYVHVEQLPVAGSHTPADRREREPAHPLAGLRHALHGIARANAGPWSRAARDERPVILHVLHGWGGGAERYVRDLATIDDQRQHLLLRAVGNPGRRQHGEFLELSNACGGPVLQRSLLTPAIGAICDRHHGYAQILRTLIAEFAIEQIWVSSLIGHSLEVLRAPLPLRWIAHDYFPFWPTLHRDFGADSGRFDAAELRADLLASRNGPFAEDDQDWWTTMATATAELLLSAAAEVIAPSASVWRNLRRVAPTLATLNCRQIAHGIAGWPDAESARARMQVPETVGKLRLVILGRINGAKGLELVRQLLPGLTEHCDLYLIGAGKSAEALFGISGVHILLDYPHAELPEILARIRPHAALLPSTVSETFSYTLSELWNLGIPPIATRLGAFVERIEDGCTGLLVDPDPSVIVQRIASLALDQAPLRHIRQELSQRPTHSLESMLSDYAALLPAGRREALRFPVRGADAAALSSAVLADALTDHQLRLDAAQLRLAQQNAELARRADWGFELNEQLRERTRWAQDLDHELSRTRQWMSERERVYERTLVDKEEQRLAAEAKLRDEHKKAMEEARLVQDERHEQLNSLTRLLEDHAVQIKALQDEKQTLMLERIDLEIHRDLMAQVEDALQLARGELQQQLAAATILRQERDALAEHRAQILHSTSWRLTAPIRVLGRLVKRIRASLRFRLSRLLSMIGRIRGSLARRGLRGTWSRLRLELREQSQSQPITMTIEHPSPALDYVPFLMPGSSAPLVSIVVPVYNQLHHTWNCLKALAETAGKVSFEVIVVDDGSSDATATEVPRIKGVRFHKNPQNLGFIGACNAGAALARGQYLFFLNNDTAVQPGWLEPLLRSFEEFDRVGLVGSKLVYPDGRLQEAGGIVFSDGSGWNYGRFDHPDDPRYDYPREADYCSGAAILIEKQLFEQFGGFDALYKPAYYEDTDLAFKVRAAGLRVIYQPASKVIHFEGISSGTDISSGTKRFQVINQAKFLERWQDTLAAQPTPTDHNGIWRAATHRARGRILLIDATTPTPDQDSGSVRYLNLIRVLRSLGWQCTFFADNRAYVPRYSEGLRALGVEVQFHPWLSDPVAFFRERGQQFDAIMLSRHYVARHYVELAREHAPQALILFDTVDLHYLREQRAAAVSKSETLARQAEATRHAELDLIRRCDVTLVVSTVEQALLAKEAPDRRVEVLSNIHEVAGRRADFDARKDIWFVGGFQHQPNVDAALWFAASIWPRVRAALPDLKFHIVGSKITPEVEALAGNGIEVHGFVENIEPFLDGCRISVAPLRYGAGVKGKVNQSMAFGQPVVATPIAVEGMAIEAGTEALVAEAADDFADAIVRLYRDPALWLRLSDAGLVNIQSHFSFEAARSALQQILQSGHH
jgi:O-antigen biosynthesis protein